MKRQKIVNCLITVIVCISIQTAARADITSVNTFYVTCRVDGKTYVLPLPMGGGPGTFGTLTKYVGLDGKVAPCQVTSANYNYAALTNFNTNWAVSATIPINGVQVLYQFTKVDNKAYWDHFYRDYTPPADLDYQQNCHGYAFGVGDWPDNASGFVSNASLPIPAVEVGKVQVLQTSSEQCRESGVYTRSKTCPEDLNIDLAISRGDDGIVWQYSLYKKDGACYKKCPIKDATIATDITNHSVKVTGAECQVGGVGQ